MKTILFVMVTMLLLQTSKAQSTDKYYFGNSTVSQNLTVKFSGKKITFTYTTKQGSKAATVYKGTATSKGGDGETDEDVDGAYDVDEYIFTQKGCTIKFRIASDKSKCRIISGGCPKNVMVDSFDTMIKL